MSSRDSSKAALRAWCDDRCHCAAVDDSSALTGFPSMYRTDRFGACPLICAGLRPPSPLKEGLQPLDHGERGRDEGEISIILNATWNEEEVSWSLGYHRG